MYIHLFSFFNQELIYYEQLPQHQMFSYNIIFKDYMNFHQMDVPSFIETFLLDVFPTYKHHFPNVKNAAMFILNLNLCATFQSCFRVSFCKWSSPSVSMALETYFQTPEKAVRFSTSVTPVILLRMLVIVSSLTGDMGTSF